METRNRILSEAFRLFLINGYRNVSLNDVVRAVGITKGGFYHYFTSKDELYVEVMDTHVLSLFDGMAAEMARHSTVSLPLSSNPTTIWSGW